MISDRITNDEIREHLLQPAVQARLAQRLFEMRNRMTTTIGQVAELLGITEAQVRYWEEQQLLTPRRGPKQHPATVPSERTNGSGRQRRYGQQDLIRLLVIKELHERNY